MQAQARIGLLLRSSARPPAYFLSKGHACRISTTSASNQTPGVRHIAIFPALSIRGNSNAVRTPSQQSLPRFALVPTYSMNFLRRITAQTDITDVVHVQQEKDRLVPFSVSPAKPVSDSSDSETDKELSPVPDWFELSADLAWAATFSSLTSNTVFTTFSAFLSYGAFFILIWPLWLTQAAYDLKYRTNDWWHRLFFGLQLAIYASFVSFSGSFNVLWQFPNLDLYGYDGSTTPAATSVQEDNEAMAFKWVNVTLMISRLLLLAQHLRILYYRRRTGEAVPLPHLLLSVSLIVSALTFLAAFLLIDTATPGRGVAIGQFVLWAFAVVTQMTGVGYIFTLEDSYGRPMNQETFVPRLRSLTAIILAEGLNGICSTMHGAFGGIGITAATFGEPIAILLILYCLWLLYFDGCQVQSHRKPKRQALVWRHLTFHLCLILTLESTKNAFLFARMENALDAFSFAFDNYLKTGNNEDLPTLRRVGAIMGQSWDQVLQSWQNTSDRSNSQAIDPAKQYTWYVTALNSVATMYQEQPDDKTQDLYNQYLSNTTRLVEDMQSLSRPMFTDLFYHYLDDQSVAFALLSGLAAGTLLSLSTLLLLPWNSKEAKGRYVLGYQLVRFVSGVILLAFAFLPLMDVFGMISIVLVVAVALDRVVLHFSVRSIKRREGEVAKGAEDSGPASLSERQETHPLLNMNSSTPT